MKTNDLYQKQLQYIFNRPVTEPAWYWTPRDEEEDVFGEDPLAAFEFIERLCQHPQSDLAPYSDDQVGLGLNFIFDNNCSNLACDFKTANVPFKRREAAIRNLFVLFRDVLNERCYALTSSDRQENLSQLNYICYMFWDVSPLSQWLEFNNSEEMALSFMGNLSDSDIDKFDLPVETKELMRQQSATARSGAAKKSSEEIVSDVLNQYANINAETEAYYKATAYVMEQCLRLSNPACVESGLHGLGHLATFLPNIAVPRIDKFLKGKNKGNESLTAYAKAARTGMIL